MSRVEAKRTLVKSPPELWAELSDPLALGRHLEDFGEIRITRAEPESLVEWEGERASGRIDLEPSGWGTRVTLVAEPAAAADEAPGVDEAPDEEPVAAEPAPPQPEPERAEPEPELAEPELVQLEPEPEPVAVAPAIEEPPRGWWARFVHRWRKAYAVPIGPEPVVDPPAAEDLPAVMEPEPAPVAAEPDPVAAEPEPQPVAVAPEPEPVADEPEPALDAEAVLKGVLDTLGSAHHRPFSRA